MLSALDLYERAESQGIVISNINFADIESVSLPCGWVAIDETKVKNNADLKEKLSHELAHCETGSFYMNSSPLELRSKKEYKANAKSYEMLVPFKELCQAVADGYRELWELAEYFDVSCKFVEKVILYYQNYGMEVPKKYYL